MPIVGEAQIVVVADDREFRDQLATAREEATAGASDGGAPAGLATGTGFREGVSEGAAGVGTDLETIAGKSSSSWEEIAGLGVLGGHNADQLAEENRKGLEQDLANREKYLADLQANEGKVEKVAKEGGGGGFLSALGVPESLLGGWGKLGLAVAATAAASVELGSKFQSAVTNIANAEAISVSAAQQVGNAFLTTAGQVQYSAKEQADAFALVAGQLRENQGRALTVKESMDFMRASMDLATASGEDLTGTTQTLASVMQAFQIPASKAAHVSDILYSTGRATGQSISQLGTSLERVRSRLGAVAPPLGDMAGLLVDMTNHGETGRMALTALSSTYQALLKPLSDAKAAQIDLQIATDHLPPSLRGLAKEYLAGTISTKDLTKASQGLGGPQAALISNFEAAAKKMQTANDAQQKLGITTENSKGQFVGMGSIIDQLHKQIRGMTSAQAIADLSARGFGSSASKMVAIVQSGSAAFDKATKSVNKQGTAAGDAARVNSTLSGEFHIALAWAEDMGVKISTFVVPVLEKLISTFFNVIKVIASVVEWLLKHKLVLVVLAAVITGAMLPALVEWAGGLYAVVAAWIAEKVQAVASMAATIISMGPLLLIIAAVAAAVYLIITHWKQIAGFFVALWHQVTRIFFDFIHVVEHIFDDVIRFIKDHWQLIVAIISGPIGIVVYLFIHFRKQIFDIFEGIVHDVFSFFDGILHHAEQIVDGIWHFFEALPGKVVHAIESGASDILHAFEKWIPGGGLVGSALSVIGLASGGVVHKPTLAVIGEAGPEAVVPLSEFGRVGGAEGVEPRKGGDTNTTHNHGDMHVYIQQPHMTAQELEATFSYLMRTGQLTGI